MPRGLPIATCNTSSPDELRRQGRANSGDSGWTLPASAAATEKHYYHTSRHDETTIVTERRVFAQSFSHED
jgi:hypothetical protein